MTRNPPAALAATLVLALVTGASSAQQLTFDALFDAEGKGGNATELKWSPDGERLAFRFRDADGEALWLFETERRSSRRLLALPFAAGEGEGDLDDYQWSPRGDVLLLESMGDLFLLDASGGAPRRLTATASAEEDPKLSPDGSRVAFVRDFDLHLLELDGGAERSLTTGGVEGQLLHGITDWVYWEEIWGRESTGFWWSPDGTRIAYYRFDESPVASYPLVNHLPVYPEVTWQRYPKAGAANPLVSVGVLDLASGRTTWLETGGEDAYLARVAWHPDGRRVAVQRLAREQDRLDLLLCEAAGGACSLLLREEWPTWVNLGDDFRFLAGGGFLWGSERTGWRQLYLYDAAGSLVRALTEAEGAVTSLDGVDESRRRVVFTAYGAPPLGAAERRVLAASLDRPAAEVLASGGWNEALVAPGTGHWVRTWGDLETPTRQAVLAADGSELGELPRRAPSAFDPASLPRWELLTLPGPGGSALPAALLRPPGPEIGRRHPVLMYHYGCPDSQVVANRWDVGSRALWHRMMAERGYVVLMVDNGASLFFGKRGEDGAHRDFGDGNLLAQLAGVEYARGLPYADAERLGLWGWSGGGSNTLWAVLNRPGVWRAAVAGAPVTDWRLYDTIWTERYLDHPEGNATGYRNSSPVTFAANLQDALLVVHGTGDDNVHPQNTLALAHAFVEAGRPFELAIYPRQKHAFTGPSSRHFFERMTAFFDRQLGDGTAAGGAR